MYCGGVGVIRAPLSVALLEIKKQCRETKLLSLFTLKESVWQEVM